MLFDCQQMNSFLWSDIIFLIPIEFYVQMSGKKKEKNMLHLFLNVLSQSNLKQQNRNNFSRNVHLLGLKLHTYLAILDWCCSFYYFSEPKVVKKLYLTKNISNKVPCIYFQSQVFFHLQLLQYASILKQQNNKFFHRDYSHMPLRVSEVIAMASVTL